MIIAQQILIRATAWWRLFLESSCAGGLLALALAAPAHAAASPAPAPQDGAPASSGIPHETLAPVVGELPFSKLPYAEARDAAAAQDKLFLVDATATWCGPCKQMEAEAWPVAEVGAWVAAHAVAVQLDVDAEKDIARELEISAMPTIILFRGDTELFRHTGSMDAAALLTWLDDAAAGRAGKGPVLAEALALMQSNDYKARYAIAKELQQLHEDELALQHYLWLWPNTRGTSFSAVRSSFMLGDMKRLADGNEAAREAFAEVFEEIREKVAEDASPDRMDWLEFDRWCSHFEHGDALRAWYDDHHEPDGSLRCDWAADTLFEHFVGAGDWASAGRLGKLEARASKTIGEKAAMKEAMVRTGNAGIQAEMKSWYEQQVRDKLSGLCAAAFAVGGDDEGRAIATMLLAELDDAPTRLQLATVSFEAVGARPEQVTWLDEAAQLDGDAEAIDVLRARLQAAAAEAPALPLQPAAPPEPLR